MLILSCSQSVFVPSFNLFTPLKYQLFIILFSGLSHHVALSIEWLEAARALAENTGGKFGETENILKHLTEKRIQHDQNWR